MAEREEREDREKRAKVDRYRVMLMDQIQSDEMLRHSLRQESQSAEYHQQMVSNTNKTTNKQTTSSYY